MACHYLRETNMYKHTGAKILFAMATGLSNVTFHIWVSHLDTCDYSVGENMAREYGIPVSERSLILGRASFSCNLFNICSQKVSKL
jgi:hypothetical protein